MRFCACLVCLLMTVASHALEQPEYEVIDKFAGIEIRAYQAYIVAQFEVEGAFDEAGNVAFEPLGDYIFGANQRDEKIGMTAPVEQRSGGSAHRLTFVMPSRYDLSTLPQPKDERIVFKIIDAREVAALRYSGNWSEARYRKHEKELYARLAESAYQPCGEPVWARFNPPFWPGFMRRNEIHVAVNCPNPSQTGTPGEIE
ncbi:MAG: heme-binding protein [Pseudomonadota bacterium]